MGNAIGFAKDWSGVAAVSPEVGANTHAYAAFDPDVTSKFPW
jgi:hypothetical protein